MAIETKKFWSYIGRYKCVCTTPSHKKGQRFTSPQCSYCEEIPIEKLKK